MHKTIFAPLYKTDHDGKEPVYQIDLVQEA